MSLTRMNNPILIQTRKGTSDDPYVLKNESHEIGSSKAILTELPDYYYKVIVTGEDTEWFEIEDGELKENQFKVDYKNKIVTFHPSVNGKMLNFEYKGTGIVYYPTSMIYNKVSEDGVVETLDDIIQSGKEGIETLQQVNEKMSQVDQAVSDASQAVEDTENAIIRLDTVTSDASSSEEVRKGDETVRKTNEEIRQSSESTRESNEDKRKLNEQKRLSDESSRVVAELERVDQESVRVENENDRESSETVRVENETERQAKETDRINAENSRKSNEAARQQSETTRETNEEERVSNEDARISEEDKRKSNEQTRLTSESKRVTAELERQDNEEERIANESSRQSAFNSKITEIDTTINETNEVKTETETLIADFSIKGEYSPTETYRKFNMVRYDGSTFMLKVDSSTDNSPTPRSDNDYWMLVAEKGYDGAGTVDSVNGKGGNVVLTADDVGAIPASQKGVVNGVARLNADGKVIDANGNEVEGKVKSVNGQTGDVTISSPTKTSQLTNDSNYETTTGSQTKANTAEQNAKSYADSKLAEMVDSAPETLNTLNELAQALGDDPNFAATISNQLGTKANKSDVGDVAQLEVESENIVEAINYLHSKNENTNLVQKQIKLEVTEDNQTTFEIPYESFESSTDYLMVVQNSTVLSPERYSVTGRTLMLNEGLNTDDSLYVHIIKVMVAHDGESYISGGLIVDGSIPLSKLSESVEVPTKVSELENDAGYETIEGSQAKIDAHKNDYMQHIGKLADGNELGHVKVDGGGLKVDETGKLSVKTGRNLTINSDGSISGEKGDFELIIRYTNTSSAKVVEFTNLGLENYRYLEVYMSWGHAAGTGSYVENSFKLFFNDFLVLTANTNHIDSPIINKLFIRNLSTRTKGIRMNNDGGFGMTATVEGRVRSIKVDTSALSSNIPISPESNVTIFGVK